MTSRTTSVPCAVAGSAVAPVRFRGSGTAPARCHDHLHREWLLDLKATLRVVEGDGETVPGRVSLRVLEGGGTGWGGAWRWTENDD